MISGLTEKEYSIVNNLIDRLWSVTEKDEEISWVLTKNEIKFIIEKAKRIIQLQPVFLELVPPLVICGDIHGQFTDLLRIFEKCGDPENTNYLFLGDYVDRGKYSVHTITLLLLYKIKHPINFFLLRGNHEAAFVNKMYGFYNEIRDHYSSSRKLWKLFNDLFDYLPISATVNGRILCIHGGISPDFKNLNQLKNLKRPLNISESRLIIDLLWSDPDSETETYAGNERGISCVFGEKPLTEILDKLGIDLLVRAHQAISTGFDFPFNPNKSIVTLFSAPNYSGNFTNSGAAMTVSTEMVCKFVVFESKLSRRPFSLIKRPPSTSIKQSILLPGD